MLATGKYIMFCERGNYLSCTTTSGGMMYILLHSFEKYIKKKPKTVRLRFFVRGPAPLTDGAIV